MSSSNCLFDDLGSLFGKEVAGKFLNSGVKTLEGGLYEIRDGNSEIGILAYRTVAGEDYLGKVWLRMDYLEARGFDTDNYEHLPFEGIAGFTYSEGSY